MAALPKGMRKELSKQYSPEEFERLIESVGGTFYDFSQQYTQALSVLPRGVGKVLAQTIAIMIGNTIKAAGHFDVHSDTIMPDGRTFEDWEEEVHRFRRGTRQLLGSQLAVAAAEARELNELMKILQIAEIKWGANEFGDCLVIKIRKQAFHKAEGILEEDVQRVWPDGKGNTPTVFGGGKLRTVWDWEKVGGEPTFDPIIIDDPVNPTAASKVYQNRAKKAAEEVRRCINHTKRKSKKKRN